MKQYLCIVAMVGVTASAGEPVEHWAFRPPVRPAIPSIANSGLSVRNPIDAFILHEQQKRGLSALGEAPKEILLRRVYLDLIGVPPTRGDLHDFVSDESPNAYERTVDRLLNSPQYGERWARHWMDVWRYSDWYGRRHVPDVWNSAPQVWRWRDWIVQSLNSDKGYDRMIVEMLAADEVAPEDDQARVATGYLVRNWYALNSHQWMRDIVEHTGKAFLGLTFNCAHCHDHKYDPITQRDYFQFRAFFEPLQVRQDRVNGEPDPGPFQEYEYGVTRRVVTNGMVSVFDEKLDAKTFIYLNGDERNIPDGKPVVGPGIPAFLSGTFAGVTPVKLPPAAHFPGLKPFVREAELKKHEQAAADATAAFRTAEEAFFRAKRSVQIGPGGSNHAQALADLVAAEAEFRNKSNALGIATAELDSVRARIEADGAKHGLARVGEDLGISHGDPFDEPARISQLSAKAWRAEKLVALRKNESKLVRARGALELLQLEQAIGASRRAAQGIKEHEKEKENREAELKKAQEQIAAAEKEVQATREALELDGTGYTPLTPVYPAQSTGRRRALAEWMVSRTNPLTARVAVNHIWVRHFHEPLVKSVFDFGRSGAPPTHPELLDWLAIELMEHDWSMKHLHRLIVTSSTYRRASSNAGPKHDGPASSQVSSTSRANVKIDPENRYLWRMNIGQMEAEILRDSILHIAEALDFAPVGYPLPNAQAENSSRRSLYFECFPEPTGQSPFAELFDAPNPVECYRRSRTVVPQQALALANGKLSNARSRQLAHHLSELVTSVARNDDTEFIIAAYEQVLCRPPRAEEQQASSEFMARQAGLIGRNGARTSLVHVLLNHHDFISIR